MRGPRIKHHSGRPVAISIEQVFFLYITNAHRPGLLNYVCLAAIPQAMSEFVFEMLVEASDGLLKDVSTAIAQVRRLVAGIDKNNK